jgi:hypothetical protein
VKTKMRFSGLSVHDSSLGTGSPKTVELLLSAMHDLYMLSEGIAVVEDGVTLGQKPVTVEFLELYPSSPRLGIIRGP